MERARDYLRRKQKACGVRDAAVPPIFDNSWGLCQGECGRWVVGRKAYAVPGESRDRFMCYDCAKKRYDLLGIVVGAQVAQGELCGQPNAERKPCRMRKPCPYH
jgi:hypothetical protein